MVSYLIQAHVECSCFDVRRDTAPGLHEVWSGRAAPHARGKAISYRWWTPIPLTADTLFARVEQALATNHVRIDSLRFDPDFGIPLLLHYENDLNLDDLWQRIVVDSFSVRHATGWTLDSVQQNRNRASARVRLGYLDSLAAARKKWERAGVIEYDIQAHSECFCFGGSDRGQLIYTVRNNRITGERPGRPLKIPLSAPVVAGEMFEAIEKVLRTDHIVVDKLEFHSELGLPLLFETDHDSGVTDGWNRMRVDTLIIRERKPPPRG